MINIKSIHFIFLLLLLFYTGTAAAQSNTILESQNVTYSGRDGKLNIQFYTPMGYVSHFPENKGDKIKISLKELLPSTQRDRLFSEKLRVEQLIDSKNNINPVLEINFEKTRPGLQAGVLTIELNRPVEFNIKMSRDRKSLTVTLKNIRTDVTPDTDKTDSSSGLPIYILNLKTSSKPIDPENQPALVKFNNYDVYVTQTARQWETSHNLHLGYFYSPSAAKANLDRLKPFYPQGWVGKIQPERRKTAETWFFDQKINRLKKEKKAAKPQKLDILMERARQAMIDKNYSQAIRIFTKIQQLGGGEYKKESKELLGLARERNGQVAHAKAEYQEYLKLYPEGEDAERVRQRLLGLLTARSRPKQKLEKIGVKPAEPEWDLFGSFRQFYRNQKVSSDVLASQTTDSSLQTDLVFTGRKRGFEYNQRFDFVANNRLDFLSDTDKSDSRVQTLYYEISKKDDNHAARIGRQTHHSDGVFGRFDGFILNKRLGTSHRINFLAGYPVDISTYDAVNTDRQFFSLSYDIESLLMDADFKFYFIDQSNNSLTDRQAVGTQIQYFDDYKSFFTSLDYDTFYQELNQATFLGTWRNKQNSSINLIANYRKAPLLSTNNALIGQPVETIEELQQLFSDDEIYQLARDRTADYTSLTIAASTFLTKRYQLNGDITVSETEATASSGGVEAIPATGVEAVYNTTLVINNFFTDNDITIFGARYMDLSTTSIAQLNFSTNFNLSKAWRLNPRLVIDSRDNINGTSRTTLKPRILVNYRPARSFKLELDMGYETAETEGAGTTLNDEIFYAYFGYIYDF
jgi:hypothetical protein